MKTNLKVFISFLVFGLFVSSTMFAQNYPQATSSSDVGVSLTTDNPLVDKYEIDFSTYNWTEDVAEKAASYLDDKSELITVEVDFPNSKLILTLDLDAPQASTWDLGEWNTHLSTVR